MSWRRREEHRRGYNNGVSVIFSFFGSVRGISLPRRKSLLLRAVEQYQRCEKGESLGCYVVVVAGYETNSGDPTTGSGLGAQPS